MRFLMTCLCLLIPAWANAADRFAAAATPPVTDASFTGLTLRTPASALYTAFQIGTGATDVIYAVLEAPKMGAVRDTAHLYRYISNRLVRGETVRGAGISTPGIFDPNKRFRGREFRFRNLQSRFEDGRAVTELNLVSGYRDVEIFHVGATVLLETPRGRSAYRIGKEFPALGGPSAAGLTPVNLLAQPSFSVRVLSIDDFKLNASMSAGGMSAEPALGSGRDVRAFMNVKGVTNRPPQTLRIRWQPQERLGVAHVDLLFSEKLKVRHDTEYELRALLDLGPVLGVFTSNVAFSGPARARAREKNAPLGGH